MGSYLRTTWTHNLYTPIPSTINPDSLTTLLHDHNALIHLSPIVTSCTLLPQKDTANETTTPTTPATESQPAPSPFTTAPAYDIRERIPILSFPFGLGTWTTEIRFQVQFSDTRSGVLSLVRAPLGLVSQAEYTVLATGSATQDARHQQNQSAATSPEDSANGSSKATGRDDGNSEGPDGDVEILDEDGNAVSTKYVLRETITSECSVIFKRFVDADMVPTRRTMAKRMMERLQEPRQPDVPDQ